MADALDGVILNPGVGGSTIAVEAVPDQVASTTVAAGSNGLSLPQATINVASSAGFTAGIALVATSAGIQSVTYAGVATGQLTGCTGGAGTMSTGAAVSTAKLAEVMKILLGGDGVNGGFVTEANRLPVGMRQTLDAGNTTVVTSANASPGSPWVGAWTLTRDVGIVRLLTVVASNVLSGLGGTFTFEFSEDGATATISEVRPIGDFATVRDFDLINAGAYYRVKFEPSRALAGGESVFVTTTQRRQNDGAFVRLAGQQIEEANAALPQTFAFAKAFDADTGKSVNIRPSQHSVDLANRLLTQLTNGSLLVFTADFTTDVLTSAGHGYVDGDAVHLTTTGVLPAPFTSSTTTTTGTPETPYWVRDAGINTFKLSTSPTGAAVDIMNNGTGIHSVQRRGQFVGTFKEVSQVGSLLSLYLSDVNPMVCRLEWSSDGASQNTDLISSTAVAIKSTSGFYIGLTVTNTMVAKYERARIVNGPSNQGPISLFETFVGRNTYQGSFGGLTDTLSILSTALLTRAVLSGTKPDGTFGNVAISPNNSLSVVEEGAIVTPSGSRFAEGVRDDIGLDFGTTTVALAVANLLDLGSVGGVAIADTTDGGAIFSSGAAPGNTSAFRSRQIINYTEDTGHGIVGDITIFLEPSSAPISGNAFVEWGFGSSADGFGYGYDALGHYTWLRKGGAETFKVRQASWNGDKCDGTAASQFVRAGLAEAVRFDRDDFYRVQGEFLYGAEQSFWIKSPRGRLLLANTHEYGNSMTATSLRAASLPIFVAVHNDTTTGGDVRVRCGSWRGGVFTSKTTTTAKTPDGVFVDEAAQGLHTANSSSVPLAAGGTFRGTWFEWSAQYVGAIAEVHADVAGTLFIDLSQDASPVNGSEVSVDDSIPASGIAYDPIVDAILRREFPLQSRWVRLRYVNGPAAQADFELTLFFVTASTSLPLQPLRTPPTGDDLASTTASVLFALHEDGVTYDELETTLNPDNGKRGLNVTVTEFDDDIQIRPLPTWTTGQAIIGTIPVQVVLNTLLTRRELSFSNDGRITAQASRVFIGPASNVSSVPGVGAGYCLPVGRAVTIALDPGASVYAVCENTGGATQTDALAGTTATGTAATPSNALTSNNLYAVVSTAAQTIVASGYSLSGTLPNIASVKIGVEANKQSGQFEQVAHVATVTGNAGNVGSVSTSASVVAAAGNFYLAAVSRENVATVTSVSGLGLAWTQVATQQSDDAKRTVDVWKGTGTPSASGVVTANFSAVATNSHIAVSRYSNVDLVAPVNAFAGAAANNATPSVSVATSSAKGLAYGAVAEDSTTATPGAGFTEQSDEQSAGGTVDGLATETKALAAGGAQTVNMVLANAKHWAMLGVTLNPAAAIDPVLTVGYKISGVAGPTTANLTLTSSTDGTQYVDVTGDRSWAFGDFALMEVDVSGGTIGAAAANVDQVFVQVVESSANQSYVSWMQVGN